MPQNLGKNENEEYTSDISQTKPIVVFMGTYPPRECGIATFNQDLFNSSQKFLEGTVSCEVAAMNLSSLDTYIYPPEVKWKIDQDNKKEYIDLANKFNNDPQVTGVIIQHEYGIYGGKYGENILSFIQAYEKPIVVTLHTVLPNPPRKMKDITRKIIKRASMIVVLTENSKKILDNVYPESINKVHIIPHGIHPTTFSTTTMAKRKLKLEKSTVLSTFGLLSRGKGIEYVIKALPKLIKKHPSILYLILGETHPVVRRKEGESYRIELAKLVTKLKLKNHVKFYDQYLSLADLIEFLKATDIYISTSINPNQAVSGTLSYALGTGRAVISTQFAQAKEIITQDTGRLVQIKKPKQYEKAIAQLLNNKRELRKMHGNAYKMTRPMLWSNVASKYSKLLTQNILPPIKLTHLTDMTDKFGLFQFAAFDIPNKKFGYTLDDNARALIACSWLTFSKNDQDLNDLVSLYLHFIERCQLPNGTFVNYLNYSHKTATKQNQKEDLEDPISRAIWALSEVMNNKFISSDSKKMAEKIFALALPHAKKFSHARSSALAIKSFAMIQRKYPKYKSELIKSIKENADSLINRLEKNSTQSWLWFDTYLGYNNAAIPESLFIAGKITNTPLYIEKGKVALHFLITKTFTPTKYLPIGHSDWYKNNEKRSMFDQQPEDPASMIIALTTAYKITHNETYKNLMTTCFSWFLGNNILQSPLYDYDNGGCFDGLHPDRVNLNQGAESQVSYLLSRIAMGKLHT